MRSGVVWYGSKTAGLLEETDVGYRFTYAPEYVVQGLPISQTLPLRSEPYESKTLFPFFDGLIPEGWLLDLGTRNWKLDPKDRFGLLLAFCRDSVGAVGVEARE
jgi:serine/threonine-protein kinase HipA